MLQNETTFRFSSIANQFYICKSFEKITFSLTALSFGLFISQFELQVSKAKGLAK